MNVEHTSVSSAENIQDMNTASVGATAQRSSLRKHVPLVAAAAAAAAGVGAVVMGFGKAGVSSGRSLRGEGSSSAALPADGSSTENAQALIEKVSAQKEALGEDLALLDAQLQEMRVDPVHRPEDRPIGKFDGPRYSKPQTVREPTTDEGRALADFRNEMALTRVEAHYDGPGAHLAAAGRVTSCRTKYSTVCEGTAAPEQHVQLLAKERAMLKNVYRMMSKQLDNAQDGLASDPQDAVKLLQEALDTSQQMRREFYSQL